LISLKKYLDMKPDEAAPSPAARHELLSSILESYRATLLAMEKSGVKACPAV
jgi:hypothetical protein